MVMGSRSDVSLPPFTSCQKQWLIGSPVPMGRGIQLLTTQSSRWVSSNKAAQLATSLGTGGWLKGSFLGGQAGRTPAIYNPACARYMRAYNPSCSNRAWCEPHSTM